MKRLFVFALAFMFIIAGLSAQPGARRGPGGTGAGMVGGGPGPGMMGGGGLGLPGRMVEELGLTEQQKSDIRKIMDAERSLMQPIREKLQQNRQQLTELEKSGQFDEARVTRLAQEQGDLTAQMIVSRARIQSQIRNVLTPEQQQKADELRGKVQERFREGHGRRGHGPGPSGQNEQ